MPNLQHLTIFDNSLTFLALQLLAEGQWPELRSLDITCWKEYCTSEDMKRTNRAVDPLAHSNWPLLERLSAEGWIKVYLCNADGQCRWPKLIGLTASSVVSKPGMVLANLKSVCLGPMTDPDCIEALAQMQLPAMRDLEVALYHKCFTAVNFKALGKGHVWPVLRTLQLSSMNLGLHSVHPLTLADWQLLSEVDLSRNCLDREAMATLAACKWPQLTRLSLADNLLDDKATEHIVNGHWPMLEKLDLSYNHLDHIAMAHLVKGQWPLLRFLDLSVNCLDYVALQKLMQGHWPKLRCLRLLRSRGLACKDIVKACKDTARSETCVFVNLLLSKSEEYMRAVAGGSSNTVSLSLDGSSVFD